MRFSLPLFLIATVLPLVAAGDDKRITPLMHDTGRTNSHVLYDTPQVQQLSRALKQAAIPSGNGINYHGGPVLTNSVTLYYIWYGNWNGNNGVTLLESFARNLGATPYFNMNTTYTDGAGAPVKNNLIFGGSVVDSYSQGKALSDAQIWQVVSDAITKGKFPSDPNALYFVLTSADVNATSGFCSLYCGWHWYNILNNVSIKYSFVGDSGRCPSGCSAQPSNSPNGNVGADGMASVMAHELSETVSDPQGDAWWDNASGGENGDKCAWTFGVTSPASNGSRYNITLGGANYLLQQMWVNSGGGGCAMSYLPPTASTIAPASGNLGASVPVTITGSNFSTGANLSISGAGVTTSNLAVVSATQITGHLNIASTADVGTHSVSVTQGLAVSSPVTFTVNAPNFTLTQVSPATGLAGTSVPITLTGTNFATGATVNVSGTGVTVSNTKIVSATQITATLAVAASGLPGPYNVTVTQAGAASSPVSFTVSSSTITLTGIAPSTFAAGFNGTVTLTGTNFPAGAAVNVPDSVIAVSAVTVVSATQITANFAVPASAAAATHNVTVSYGTNVSTAKPVTVTAAPNFNSMSPASGQAGATTKLTLSGTNFVAGTNVNISGTGVTVSGVTVVRPTQLTANLAIPATAAAGSRMITVSYGSFTSKGAAFTIVSAPAIVAASPNSAASGTTTKITLTGTNFVSGVTVGVSGSGVSVNTVTVVSATQITANFVVDALAAAGSHNVTVSSGTFSSAPTTFTVTTAAPTLASISPATGAAGATVNVTLTGTHFTTSDTIAVSGTGVTVSNINAVSPTQITAQFVVSGTAATGARSVTVSNGTATTAAVTFTVTAPSPAPTLTGLDKTTAAAGATLTVTATGSNFSTATKLYFSGAGVTIGGVQFISATQIAASVTVASTAAAGVRTVTASNNGAAGTVSAGSVNFTITASSTNGPTVTKMSPNTGVLGNAIFVTLTGTGFTPTSIAITNDPNTTPVLQTTYVGPTQLLVIIGLGGAIGNHTLTVAVSPSSSAATSAPLTFTITAPPPPTTAGMTPASGGVGKTLTVTIQGTNFTPNMVVAAVGTGITVGNMMQGGPTFATVPLTISPNATIGAHTLTVSTPGGTSNAVTFTVKPSASSVRMQTEEQTTKGLPSATGKFSYRISGVSLAPMAAAPTAATVN